MDIFFLRESKYVIVAPHADGKDKHTRELAEQIGLIMKASIIIKHKKENKSENFNKLPWNQEQKKYDWDSDEQKKMWKFCQDILTITELAKKSAKNPIVVYVHGLKDDIKDKTGVDIGFGVSYNEEKDIFEESKLKSVNGKKRCDEYFMRALKINLQPKIQPFEISFGKYYNAWAMTNLVQIHTDPVYSFQLEITLNLREKYLETGEKIAKAMIETFEKS